jgi:hypothetical protein
VNLAALDGRAAADGGAHRLCPVEDEQTQHFRIPEFAVRLGIAAAL